MRIVIAGGHGKIALLLGSLLARRGEEVVGIIRDPRQTADLSAGGIKPVVLDLERATVDEVAPVMRGAAVAVFAAGAGPGSGIPRKYTVDEGAANLCTDAALAARVPGLIQISAMGTDDPPTGDEVFSHYLRAKAAAEQHLRDSGLPHVILRPGRLTDEPGTGLVELARHVPHGSISRPDVAAVVAALIDTGPLGAATLELVGGGSPIPEAVARASRSPDGEQ